MTKTSEYRPYDRPPSIRAEHFSGTPPSPLDSQNEGTVRSGAASKPPYSHTAVFSQLSGLRHRDFDWTSYNSKVSDRLIGVAASELAARVRYMFGDAGGS